ncbi:TniQ family protein [Aquamicrobium segne]|uniref:TniQ family protein n=1 Tax=Aquamicrobium segne TaxID=469547 RepID=A0ABW0GZZ8_9HYPH
MTKDTPLRQLPVRLPPHPDELLSSWISRHAAFYAVPPLIMLQHCLPETSSLRAADLHLSSDQQIRLANTFITEQSVMRRMTFADIAQSSRQLISARPTQICTSCSPDHMEPTPVLRSQLLGWRITCPLCGSPLRDVDGRERPSPFRQYRDAVLRGEKLLDDEAERGISTWASPAGIVRLLLMRRRVFPFPAEEELWRFRVLGKIIPELDRLLAEICTSFPTPQNPVLPLYLRPALMAGVAMVHSGGAEMLFMLRQSTFGFHRHRFDREAMPFFIKASRTRHSTQIQLI